MHTSQKDTLSAAAQLGQILRNARKRKKWTIAQLAEALGRPREWLNRVELGYSEFGEHKPPTEGDMRVLINVMPDISVAERVEMFRLRELSEAEFNKFKLNRNVRPRKTLGKLTQAEVVMGEEAVVDAILDLINQQHSDAVLRNTGIRGQGSFVQRTEYWKKYREALGDFLAKNPNGVFKRIEYVANENYLHSAKESDSFLTGGRKIEEVHNAKVKFRKNNPLSLHLLIGQREAILALPLSSGQPGSNMALVVRDKIFVEALRVWYDEVLWEGQEPSTMVDFGRFEESFEAIKQMYGYNN